MRRHVLIIGVACILALLSGHLTRAQDIKITDYEVPVSRSHELYVTGDFARGENDYLYEETDYSAGGLYSNESYRLNGSWRSFYNSPFYAWNISTNSTVNFIPLYDYKIKLYETASASGNLRRYISDKGLFFGAAGFSTSWAHNYDRPDGDLSASVGLGRTVEATVLARAIRIDEFLIKEGILGQHLTKKTLLALAAIIDQENQYKMQYGDTYSVWWYAEMERLIAEAVSLPGGSVGPIGLFRIREVLEQEQVQRRVHGWTCETGISTAVARSNTSDLGEPDVFVAAAVAYPLGLKQQFIAEGRVSTRTGETFGDYYLFDASFKYVYELSNLIDVIIGDYYHQRGSVSKVGVGEQIETGYGKNAADFSILYYVENALTIRFGGNLEHRWEWLDWHGFRKNSYRRWQVNFSFGYHIF